MTAVLFASPDHLICLRSRGRVLKLYTPPEVRITWMIEMELPQVPAVRSDDVWLLAHPKRIRLPRTRIRRNLIQPSACAAAQA